MKKLCYRCIDTLMLNTSTIWYSINNRTRLTKMKTQRLTKLSTCLHLLVNKINDDKV